jgi:hypothetical protein
MLGYYQKTKRKNIGKDVEKLEPLYNVWDEKWSNHNGNRWRSFQKLKVGVELEIIMLSKIHKTEKDKYHTFSLTWGIYT